MQVVLKLALFLMIGIKSHVMLLSKEWNLRQRRLRKLMRRRGRVARCRRINLGKITRKIMKFKSIMIKNNRKKLFRQKIAMMPIKITKNLR